MKKFAWLVLLLLFVVAVFSQEDKNTPQEYVELYHEIAVQKMHEYKIPASITLAQGILESGNGNSALSRNANNHFGIKCHSDWTGEGYYMDDDAEDECFRVYDTPEGSYADHSLFLTSRVRYKFLFEECDPKDYECWANGLKKAGYATNPKYPTLLISLIERYDLAQYDKMDYTPSVVDEPVVVIEHGTEIGELEDLDYVYENSDIFVYNKREAIKSKNRQLLDIAVAYDIPLEKLMKINDMNEGDILQNYQNVFLQKKRKKGFLDQYVVRRGETMWEISQKHGIQLGKLYSKNQIPVDMHAMPGERLSLAKKVSTAPAYYSYEDVMEEKKKLAGESLPEDAVTDIKETLPTDNEEIKETNKQNKYTVKAGDTLYSISNKFYVPVAELIKINKLSSTNLSIGQVLLVSPK